MPTREVDLQTQATFDMEHIVKPFLVKKYGWPANIIGSMLTRIQWGTDYASWTLRLTDNGSSTIPDIERVIRAIQHGQTLPVKWLLQAYLTAHGTGPILSFGMISVHMLALLMDTNKNCYERDNPAEPGVSFRCLKFTDAIEGCPPGGEGGIITYSNKF